MSRSLHGRAMRADEVRALYRALRDQARDAMVLAEKAKATGGRLRDDPYRTFKQKVQDFQALSDLLRRRIKETSQDWTGAATGDLARVEAARAEFDRLDLLMLSLFVRTSRRYVTLLAFNPALPLGAVDWLRRDLPALLETLERLRAPALAAKVDPGLEAELRTAILILNDLIGRLPELPEFRSR